MPTEVVMPRLSDTMEEGTLLRWLKQPGDAVKKGDALAEVETDKANMEVEAFEEGVLSETLVSEGDTVPVGEPIAYLSDASAEPSEKKPPPGKQKPEQKKTPAQAEEILPPSKRRERRREEPTDFGDREPEQAEKEIPATTQAKGAAAGTTRTEPPATQAESKKGEPVAGERVKASPLARKLADAYGIDLSTLQGSGPGGRIIERDVDQVIQQQRQKKEPVQEKPPIPKKQTLPVTPPEKPSKIRQTIAKRMSQSKQEIPHFYVTVSIRADRLVRCREQLKKRFDISYSHLLTKACAMALVQHPRLNASYENADRVTFHPEINIAFAMAIEDGLLTPVIHRADQLSLQDIAEQSLSVAKRVLNQQLQPEDLSGATFTISNMGMYEVDQFSAIINPPQAAILAVGALTESPVIENGVVIPGYRMKLTLAADHRVLNGSEAAEFLQTLRQLLENPVLLEPALWEEGALRH